MANLELRVPPVVVTAAFAGLLWLAAVLTPSLAVSVPGRAAVAVVFLAVGAAVALAGAVAFRRASTTVNPVHPERTSSLVTSGIYRTTRNPMYLGLLLVLIGWGVWLAYTLSLVIVPLFVAYMNRFQIEPEERALRATFGKTFASYARATRRWL